MAKCEYCRKPSKAIVPAPYFCSKKCKDNLDAAVATNRVKTPVMEAMRSMANGDIEREKLYLQSLIGCLQFDLKDREK